MNVIDNPNIIRDLAPTIWSSLIKTPISLEGNEVSRILVADPNNHQSPPSRRVVAYCRSICQDAADLSPVNRANQRLLDDLWLAHQRGLVWRLLAPPFRIREAVVDLTERHLHMCVAEVTWACWELTNDGESAQEALGRMIGGCWNLPNRPEIK